MINSTSLAHGGTPDLTGATLGTYSYQWEASTTSTSAGFSAISGATSITYQPGTLTTTTFYRRKVTTPNDPAVYSNVVTINVNALPVVATIANSSICAGSGIILTTTGANTYSWSPSTGLSATNVAAPTANPSTTTTYTVTGIDINGCSNTSSTTITVNALPTITLGSTSSVNTSATSFNLPYTATTGSPNQYSLSVTTPNALSGFTTVSNATLGSSPISVTIPASAVGVYNFNINVTNSSTGCVSPNVGFTQTITQAPPVNLSYTNPNVYTTGVTITNLTPTVTGSITSYTISPALPSGLSINGTTGIISGTPNAASPQTTYLVTASNAGGSVSANVIITVINNTVVQPQGGISAVDYNLLSTDTIKIKANISAGTAPFTLIIKNSLNATIDTITNVLNGGILKFNPVASNVYYTITKIIDANAVVRSSAFTKDTTAIKILKPNIALTLKAGAAVKQPDNSFKTTLSLKIKNSGEIDLGNVQVNANLSEVFPAGINYKLDSVKVVNGNFLINPNYTGAGSSKSPSSVTPGFSTILAIKSNAVLDANYLFTNGVNLAINEEGQVLYYLSIAPTAQAITLKLQFTSSGDGQIVKSDGTISQQNKVALSDDGTNIIAHPNNTNFGTPAPTYLPLFPIEKIGTSLNIGQATPVTGGYTFPFDLKVKNYGNLNLDSIQIVQSFVNTFSTPDNAVITGTLSSTSNITLNTNFNGYTDSLLVNYQGKLIPGDSAIIHYTLFVATSKTSATWLNQFSASGRSSIDYMIVSDTSMSGVNPDPNNDGDPIESGLTRFYINYLPPLPPVVNNAIYTYNTNYPSSISGLVKSYPVGTLPVWCNSITSICQTNAPNTPTIIGKYVYQLRSYDTTSKLYSIDYVNDTVIIKPPVPIVIDSIYLIGNKLNPLNTDIQVKGLSGSSLIYYLKSNKLAVSPTLGTTAGTTTYAVSQLVNQVESDTVNFKVTMINSADIIHIQKKSSEPILQSNSTFNVSFEFIVTNRLNKQLDSVIITDNLLNAINAPSTFNVVSVSSTGGLIVNKSFNGNVDFTLTTNQSILKPLAVDTIKLNVNISPYGFSGKLFNTAYANAKSPFGKIQISSSSTGPIGETVKTPTLFTIPDLAINIPEGFSPNRDGVNDNFVIIKPYGTILELEIFNRWGNVVYTSTNYNNDWDGKGTKNFIGQDLPDGGYYYTLRATDRNGAAQIFKGFVLIQR
jgi:gliding motility-associated-like protein